MSAATDCLLHGQVELRVAVTQLTCSLRHPSSKVPTCVSNAKSWPSASAQVVRCSRNASRTRCEWTKCLVSGAAQRKPSGENCGGPSRFKAGRAPSVTPGSSPSWRTMTEGVGFSPRTDRQLWRRLPSVARHSDAFVAAVAHSAGVKPRWEPWDGPTETPEPACLSR